jgi:translation initiation factor 1
MASSKLVWTSDPEEARRLRESGKVDASRDAEASKQTIRVTLDRKQRAGKTVTVAGGFQLTSESLAAVAATLKKTCGSGGTAKDGVIEIQGDHVARVSEELRKMGYRVKQ